MTANPPTIICGNPACKVAETGQCVEGLATATCPHYGKAPTSLDATPIEGDQVAPVAAVVFSRAQKLTVAEVGILLRQHPSRVVAIIGPNDAGKTSLIAGLYELFQHGPIGTIEFAESSTLHAFESACHESRLESGRETPDTERTKRGTFGFYHLNVGNSETLRCTTLLLGDRAGEEYLEASDDIEVAHQFDEVRRADVITMLADGARLADAGSRHNVSARVERILHAFQGAGVISPRQRMALVMTKLDAVRDSANADRAFHEFAELTQRVTAQFRDAFASIEAFQVAASPKSVAANPGDGVPNLLDYWLIQEPLPVATMPVPIVLNRAIGRLTVVEEGRG